MSDTIKRPGTPSARKPPVRLVIKSTKKAGFEYVRHKATSARKFRVMLRTAPLAERVKIEREGVPYIIVQSLIDNIGVSSSEFQAYVGIPKATFTKKMKDRAVFAGTPGQSVVGLMDLINKVDDMLAAENDNEAARNFDVEKWVGDWIQRPQPALGGMAPAQLMDTPSGRASVMRVLGAIQSGAYQ